MSCPKKETSNPCHRQDVSAERKAQSQDLQLHEAALALGVSQGLRPRTVCEKGLQVPCHSACGEREDYRHFHVLFVSSSSEKIGNHLLRVRTAE
jgi:hypothetical protein